MKWVLERIEGGKFIVKQEGLEREMAFTKEWNRLVAPGLDPGAWLTYSPHDFAFSFPLWEGKKWQGSYTGQGRRGMPWFTKWVEVERWESVTVPAGTFEALKIARATKVLGRQNRSTCWYAPEVHQAVKCEGDLLDSSELVRYELK